MKRNIILIDEKKCNGCGLCVSGCHEGALQMINGKARLVSELYCDGLGACIGDCPVGAITIETREAEAYDEIATIKRMMDKGNKTVMAHLKHLKDHNENEFLNQGITYLKENKLFPEILERDFFNNKQITNKEHHEKCACPGGQEIAFVNMNKKNNQHAIEKQASELKHWPVQMHLINPNASYFKNADVVLAADCVAFAMGNFHSDYLKGKSLAIACPKLDSNKEVYVEKIRMMIEEAKINTLTVMLMEVPCCGGLLQMAQIAASKVNRKIPIKMILVSLQGDVLKEEWV